MIFHPTPWRGLTVILGAMQLVKNPLILLSMCILATQIYGESF
jgi:hypothetical protein